MRRPFPRLAAACAFAVAMTAFTGSAFAGNGNGNGTDSAPGQVKKDQPAATQAPAPATAQPQQQAATQPQSGQDPPGQAKKQQSTASASAQSSTQLGVKPASHTTKWTHCIVGQAAGVTTCTSSDNGHTPQPNVDASKKYGNGTTAAQIVVSRGGASANVQLTGPGNSQPHKVTLCGKPSNKSGGVDVHAVKDYSAAACSQTPAKAAAIVPQAPCGFVVAAATSETGKSHGHGKGLSHNKHETATTSFSVQPDSTQSCHSAAAVAPATQLQAAVAPVTPAASPVMQSSSPAMQSSTAAPVTKRAAGGVLGVQTTLASPKPARGGVLGAATHLAGSSLPFTGFPIWLAVVLAVALILAGLALRRRGAPTRA